MYFRWRNTPYGIIRISCEGLYNFADKAIKSKLRLYSVTLSPSDSDSGSQEDAKLSIVLSESENLSQDSRDKITSHYDAVLRPMGIISAVIWAAPEKGIAHILQNSWTWAGVASCTAIITAAGFEGFFWTAFWGSAAWFTVRALTFITRYFRGA